MIHLRFARLTLAGALLAVASTPACGGRTTLDVDGTGGTNTHNFGQGGAVNSAGGSTSNPGVGGTGHGGMLVGAGGHAAMGGLVGVGPAAGGGVAGPGPGQGGSNAGHGPGPGVGGQMMMGPGPGPGMGGTSTVGHGAGGAPDSCGPCAKQAGSSQCGMELAACESKQSCHALNDCVNTTNCLSLTTQGDIVACVAQACGAKGIQTWQALAQCEVCACGEVCPVATMCTGPGPGPGLQGMGGAPQGCSDGSQCVFGPSCQTQDPNQPACTIFCNCTSQGTYSCGESCSGPGPIGIGGAPGGCFGGSACVLGPVCVTQDPMQPQCTIQCNCGPSGTYETCGETCGDTCSQGSKCQPGTGCGAPGPGPDCFTNCQCDPGGFYDCATMCGAGPQGVGGAPQTCDNCLTNTLNGPACSGQLNNCLNTPGCVDLVNCSAGVGCLDQPNPIVCGLNNGCTAPGNSFPVAATLVTCGECNGCLGTCPADPNQCAIADGPFGVGPGPMGIGPGGGSGPAVCGNCTLTYLQQGGCNGELAQCGATPGCSQLEQCWINVGCFNTSDPVACGENSGCPSSQQALNTLLNVMTCAECSGVCPTCNVACPGTMGVGATGAGGTGSAQVCNDCLNAQSQSGSCPKEGGTCSQSPDCNGYIQCASMCMDQACQDKCGLAFPKGETQYLDYFWCLACEPQTCLGQCKQDYAAFCSMPPP